MSEMLDLLLRSDAPDVRRKLPEKQFEVIRLSEVAGVPVVFTLRALPYGTIQDIRQMPEDDQEAQIAVQGCMDPSFKSQELMDKYETVTPIDALRAMLLPGEIADIALEVERLSGYRRRTITEVKNA